MSVDQSLEHSAPLDIAVRPRTALAPWLPPRQARSRPPVPGSRTEDRVETKPVTRPTAVRTATGAPESVTVAVEVTVAGVGAVTVGAEIADQLRSLATALANQSSSEIVAVNAALVLSGERPQLTDHPLLVVQPAARTVLLDGESVEFTRREFDLLQFLAAQPGQVFTRGQLLRTVWGYEHIGGERTVDVHIRRIRAKLGQHDSLVRTVRGVGYRFVPPADGGSPVLAR